MEMLNETLEHAKPANDSSINIVNFIILEYDNHIHITC